MREHQRRQSTLVRHQSRSILHRFLPAGPWIFCSTFLRAVFILTALSASQLTPQIRLTKERTRQTTPPAADVLGRSMLVRAACKEVVAKLLLSAQYQRRDV